MVHQGEGAEPHRRAQGHERTPPPPPQAARGTRTGRIMTVTYDSMQLRFEKVAWNARDPAYRRLCLPHNLS